MGGVAVAWYEGVSLIRKKSGFQKQKYIFGKLN